MATGTFPLLVLPYLAICEVLDNFSLNELIQFSFITKRTQRIASRKPKGKVKISLRVEYQPKFIVGISNSDSYKFRISGLSAFLGTRDWKRASMCGKYIVSKTTGNSTETFWKDDLTGIEKVGMYLTELLKSPITEIHLLTENNRNDTMRVIDWLSSRQKSVEKCVYDAWTTPDKYLTHLLANLQITDEFQSLATSQEMPFLRTLGMELSDDWFTVEHLMSMDCQYVDIKNRNIGSKDLNRFLKHWQNGGCGSLGFLRLEMSSGEFTDITEGIEVERVPDTVSRLYKGCKDKRIEMRGGHDIIRDDGTIGTIFLCHHHRVFHFVVKPDVWQN